MSESSFFFTSLPSLLHRIVYFDFLLGSSGGQLLLDNKNGRKNIYIRIVQYSSTNVFINLGKFIQVVKIEKYFTSPPIIIKCTSTIQKHEQKIRLYIFKIDSASPEHEKKQNLELAEID